MQTVYCISGLGADEKVFKFLDLSFAKPVFIRWPEPIRKETLQQYALRIKQEFIHEPAPVILGLSLGGMIAVEIGKAIPSAKIIIISSAKTRNEIPFYWKFFQYMPIYKILPQWSLKSFSGLQRYFLSLRSDLSKTYIKGRIQHTDSKFYKWAVGAILTWKNETIPLNVTHIHGRMDKLLPYRLTTPDISVIGGGHLMIVENAKDISLILKQILNNPNGKTELEKSYFNAVNSPLNI